MTKETFARIEAHMLSCMNDGAHDEQHVYRVLYAALDIASEYQIDLDVLIAAAFLHDIGRDAQFKDPKLDHAVVGSEMAYVYLRGLDWSEEKSRLLAEGRRSAAAGFYESMLDEVRHTHMEGRALVERVLE